MYQYNTTLPAGLSEGSITATLQEGTHQGRQQLWAPHSCGGKSYKLVVRGRSGSWAGNPKSGETWELWADSSPNGHVVFCRAAKLVEDADGVAPIVKEIQNWVAVGHYVEIHEGRGYDENRRGTIASLSFADGEVVIGVKEALRGVCTSIENFVLRCPVAETRVPHRKHGWAFTLDTWVDRKSYHLIFRS